MTTPTHVPPPRPLAAASRPAADALRDARLVVLLNDVETPSGGLATVRDLIAAVRDGGARVAVGLTAAPTHGVPRFGRAPDLGADERFLPPPTIASVRVRHGVDGAWRVTPGRLLAAAGRDALRHARRGRDRARARRILAEADVVLAAGNLSRDGLAALRRATSARVALNHAGSPEMFRRWVLTERHAAARASSPEAVQRAFLAGYDAILLQSDAHRDELAGSFPELADRLRVVRPSVDEAALRAAARAPSPYPTGRAGIAVVGSVAPRKAQLLALEAFRAIADAVPEADLHVVGGFASEAYARELVAASAATGLRGRVLVHGHRDDHARFLAHARVVLQPSLGEGVSRVLREAMFLRVPIVAFALSGTADTVRDGREAFLAPVGDAAALGAALLRALRDEATARAFAAAAHARYLRRHRRELYDEGIRGVLAGLVRTA